MSANQSPLGPGSRNTQPVTSISASQSLSASELSREPISTGLKQLNKVLDFASTIERPGGILRGQVTEVYGPPGVGKTSLALSIASNALHGDGKVVWIDTSSPIPKPRLNAITPAMNLENMIYFRAPTLPHLLALLCHPPKDFPPPKTSVLIVDSISALFPSYFLNAAELKDREAKGKIADKLQLQWLLNRKWNVISELAAHLSRLANRGIAVLVLNQTHTKIKGQPRATLQPLLTGGTWDNHVQTRLVMYRDLPDGRFIEITKRGGRMLNIRSPENIVSFRIAKNGLCGHLERQERLTPLPMRKPFQAQVRSQLGLHVQTPTPAPAPQPTQPTPSRKRKAPDEIADSQDEDSDDEYDWNDPALLASTS